MYGILVGFTRGDLMNSNEIVSPLLMYHRGTVNQVYKYIQFPVGFSALSK